MVGIADVVVHGDIGGGEGVGAEDVAEELPAGETNVEIEGAGLRAAVEGVVGDAAWIVDAKEGSKLTAVESIKGFGVGCGQSPGAGVVEEDRLHEGVVEAKTGDLGDVMAATE